MNKKLTAILVVVLCVALVTVFGMTAAATGPDGDNQTVSSEQSGSSSDTSVDTTTSSDQDTSSGEETSSNEGTSSDDDTSSDGDSSSDASSDADSSDESTSSSGTTSSKPNKPITSGGKPDNNKFVGETGSQLSSDNTVSVDFGDDDTLISDEYNDGVDENIDEYYEGGDHGFVADDIYKVIWIPITLAVLCIAGLIIVNVMFKKKYPKTKGSSAKSTRYSSYEAPKRRNRK